MCGIIPLSNSNQKNSKLIFNPPRNAEFALYYTVHTTQHTKFLLGHATPNNVASRRTAITGGPKGPALP